MKHNKSFIEAGILGNKIMAVSADTPDANCLNACSTPCLTASAYPVGTIGFITCGTAIPAGAKALYII